MDYIDGTIATKYLAEPDFDNIEDILVR